MSAADAVKGFGLLEAAVPGYETAHSYYTGARSEVFGSRLLKRMLRRQGAPYRVPVIKAVVDAVGDRLDLMSAVVPKDDAATKLLADIMRENGIEEEAPQIHHRIPEFGDAYLLVWDGAEEDDLPIVTYHSPMGMRVVYDPDNPRRKLFAVQAWQEKTPLGDAEVWRVNLLYRDRIERWRTKAGTKPGEATAWEEALADPDDEDSWEVENPYGEVPVFHFRNGTPYGSPRHFDGYGAQDAVNKLVISHMSTIDFHIAPQRYAITEGGNVDDDLDLDDDPEFDTDAGADGEGAMSDSDSGLKVGPGEMMWLTNVKSVGQFEPSKSEAFTGPLSMYLRLMAQTTKTPLDLLEEVAGSEPSGESRRRKDAPLTDAVKSYSKMCAAVWGDALSFALKVAGLADREVKVTFAPAEVTTDLDGWQTIKAKVESGVPVRVVLLEAGYLPEQVDEWFPEGEENSLRVADLEAVSRILQQLGSAVALDIITAEEARALLPEGVLPDGAPTPDEPAIDDEGEELPEGVTREQADALGVLIRAGVAPESAAEQLGLVGLDFTGAVPASLRLPERDAASLEEG